jgi:hypothetical protein
MRLVLKARLARLELRGEANGMAAPRTLNEMSSAMLVQAGSLSAPVLV